MITFAICVLIVGAILYGLIMIVLFTIGGIQGIYYGIKAARENPHPIELTDWFREKYLSKS